MEQRLEMRGGGALRLRPEGARVRLEAERGWKGDGLYKVWLWGRNGGRFLLGTLAPEGERLVLRRTISLGELERAGCWPVAGAEASLAFPFQSAERWYREPHPERLMTDSVLRAQIRGPVLCRKGRDGFHLAVPFRTDSAVPLSALICLGRVERLEGRPHLLWEFDREGKPKLPHKGGDSGQTRGRSGDDPAE